MSEQDERDLTPQPNPIVTEPATAAACQRDYDQAGDVRERLGWKDGQS
ncbi:hypothetical protein [Streptomyces sp. L2]|nr:hypothetical protein [Streptomyces sp. L2]